MAIHRFTDTEGNEVNLEPFKGYVVLATSVMLCPDTDPESEYTDGIEFCHVVRKVEL